VSTLEELLSIGGGAEPPLDQARPKGAIDRSKPIIENDDGSFSTERTITVEEDGRFYNVPTIVNGKQLGERDAIDSWIRGDHEHVGEYGSLEEAEAAARSRSDEIGRVRSRDRVKPSGAAVKDEEFGAKLLGLDLSEPSPQFPVRPRSVRPSSDTPSSRRARSRRARAACKVQPADMSLQEPPEREADWLEVLKASPAALVTGYRQAKVGVERMLNTGREENAQAELATGQSAIERGDRARAIGQRRGSVFDAGQDPDSNLDARDLLARGTEPAAPLEPERQAELTAALGEATRRGEELQKRSAEVQKEIELTTPEDMTTMQKAVISTVQSAPATLVGISVGILTKNPVLAMAIAGGGGAAQQAGQTYEEATQKGAGNRLSSIAATIDGFLEGVGEAIPLAAALKPGSRFMRRLFTTVGEEAGQEAITQVMQDFNAYLTYNPEITLQEAWENMKVAALAGAMGGAVFAGVGHLADSKSAQNETPSAAGPMLPPGGPPSGAVAPPKATAAPFAATHRLDNIPVAPHQEEGEQVAGVWRDAEGNFHEAPRAEPIQSPEPNAVWKVNGVDYDVEVTGKGRAANTARIADGQEVPIAELDLDDDAKVLLGLIPPEAEETSEKDKSNKGEGAATGAAPNSKPVQSAAPAQAKPAAPAESERGEAEPPPPRGSRRAPSVEQPVAAGPLTTDEEVKAHNAKVVATDAFQKLAKAAGRADVVFDRNGAITALGPKSTRGRKACGDRLLRPRAVQGAPGRH
jgi:hypothetical protein